jgi:hypothetical protein
MKRTILLPALLTTLLGFASADTITILPASSIADATTERNSWLTTNFGSGTTAQSLTGFENYAYGPWTSLNTPAGTFSVMPGSKCSTGSGTHTKVFTILDNSDTPFSGRYNTTPGGKNWLDSNDLTEIQLTTTFDAIYFFITDVNDWSGNLKIQTADGTISYFPQHNANGNIFFVGITSPDPIGYVRWLETDQEDGYGLDDFGTAQCPTPAPVPEPATWIVAAVALLILAAAVHERDRQGASSEQSSKERRESRRRGR